MAEKEPLQPADSLIFFQYRCSACSEIGDTIPLAEVQQDQPKHICVFCGNVDPLKSVGRITCHFHEHSLTPKGKVKRQKIDEERAIEILVGQGFKRKEAERGIQLVLSSGMKIDSLNDLVKGVFSIDDPNIKTNDS